MAIDDGFQVKPADLQLAYVPAAGARRLAFAGRTGSLEQWRDACRGKLRALLGLEVRPAGAVRVLRATDHDGVRVTLVAMQADAGLEVPAYLLMPARDAAPGTAVLAIHGHGTVEGCLSGNDYHRNFPLELARAGHVVLAPALRGFGALANLAAGLPGRRLDYWIGGWPRAFSLATDAFLRGQTMIGMTVADLLAWEGWLAGAHGIGRVIATGISYGGDLALTYPVFSTRVAGIFASGTLGSFEPVFGQCYNAPAHCIPGVLAWMDRSDIAGLNAPRPITLQYGALDRPGPTNYSASYNETVEPSVEALREIYGAAGAAERVQVVVTAGVGHVMDVPALLAFVRAVNG